MPTIKSLEERIDDMVSDVATVRSDLIVEIATLRTEVLTETSSIRSEMATKKDTNDQFAAMRAEFAAMRGEFAAMRKETTDQFATTRAEFANAQSGVMDRIDKLNTELRVCTITSVKLEETGKRMEKIVDDFPIVRTKFESDMKFIKWIGAFLAGVTVTVIIMAFSVTRSAGALESTAQHMQKEIDEIKALKR